jgi:diadenosine tetraphosphatase ApaH/serine/threonine PP2A family protein phosphatase/Ca2+-binding EF-hand superfamily protein
MSSVVADNQKKNSREGVDDGNLTSKKENFRMWSEVDQYDESHVINQSIVMRSLDMVTGRSRRRRRQSTIIREYENDLFPADMKITNKHVENLVENIVSGNKIDITNVQNLMKTFTNILRTKPNVTQITVPKEGRITVVGDTHGQLSDLVYILKRQGMPNKDNMYLFNGDFVDRGLFGTEVFTILAALKIANPEFVFLNRGNHESEKYNVIYGFEKEVVDKYDKRTFHFIETCFNVLPLCAVLNKEVFIVHGGLSRNRKITLRHINHIHRNIEIPSKPRSTEEQIMQDLLWSDPMDEFGVQPNSRGAGCLFGPNITANFLKLNKFKTIIRSHELVDDGYDIKHDDQCYTLFSASNYCGDAGNEGAIMIFKGGIHWNHHPSEIHPYMAPRLDVEKGKTMAEIEEAERQQLEVERNKRREARIYKLTDKLAEYILRFHEDLEFHFGKATENNNDLVSFENWADIMSDILKVKLPWVKLRPYLAPDVEVFHGIEHVNFRKFLARYVIDFDYDHGFFDNILNRINLEIHKVGADLTEAFKRFDVDGDGKISCQELGLALTDICPDIHLASEQIDQLLRAIDSDGDGSIDLKEFIDKFGDDDQTSSLTLTDNAATTIDDADSNNNEHEHLDWKKRLKQHLMRTFYENRATLNHAFQCYDTDCSGYLSKDNFENAIKALLSVETSIKVPDAEIEKLAKSLFDESNDERGINYNSFINRFSKQQINA